LNYCVVWLFCTASLDFVNEDTLSDCGWLPRSSSTTTPMNHATVSAAAATAARS
jgi:hypothetical protein